MGPRTSPGSQPSSAQARAALNLHLVAGIIATIAAALSCLIWFGTHNILDPMFDFPDIPCGKSEVGSFIHQGEWHFTLTTERPGFYTHSDAPFTEYTLLGFGYTHWPLVSDGPPKVVAGECSQVLLPMWFVSPLFIASAILFLRAWRKERVRTSGFEVLPPH